MTIDERLERLTERTDALAESVELMHHDMQQWIEHSKQQQERQDTRYEEMRRSIMRAIGAYMQPPEDQTNGG